MTDYELLKKYGWEITLRHQASGSLAKGQAVEPFINDLRVKDQVAEEEREKARAAKSVAECGVCGELFYAWAESVNHHQICPGRKP